jgi:hypothetical protein
VGSRLRHQYQDNPIVDGKEAVMISCSSTTGVLHWSRTHWRSAVGFCSLHPEFLNDWEVSFLESFGARRLAGSLRCWKACGSASCDNAKYEVTADAACQVPRGQTSETQTPHLE